MKSYITQLRFPLACLVVLIHSYNAVWRGAEWADGDAVPQFLSRILPTFAVPAFFVVSGYLFFLNIGQADWRAFGQKLRHRALTLLVPYVVWNSLAFLLYAGQDVAAGRELSFALSPNVWWGCKEMAAPTSQLFGWPAAAATAPVLEQLWFVRDLMVCALFSPLIYTMLRRGRVWTLMLLAVIFYGQLWPNWGGVSFTGPWFFALGAWFALSGRDLLENTRRLLPTACLVMAAALALLTFNFSENEWLRRLAQSLYVLSATVVSLHAAGWLAEKRKPAKWLAESSFFIYAAHTIVLLPLTMFAVRLAEGRGGGVQTLLWLMCPAVAVAVCLSLFLLLNKTLPRLSAPLTGLFPRRRVSRRARGASAP